MLFSLLSSLRAHQLRVAGGCIPWWLWHLLFTDMAGSIPFLSLLLVPNSTNIWETFHDQFWSHSTGRLIPNQVKIPIDRPLQFLISGLGPVDKILWILCFTSLLWSRKCFPLLLLPIPQIILLQLFYKSHTCDLFPQDVSVQLLSRVRLFVTPWITARQASLSITNS